MVARKDLHTRCKRHPLTKFWFSWQVCFAVRTKVVLVLRKVMSAHATLHSTRTTLVRTSPARIWSTSASFKALIRCTKMQCLEIFSWKSRKNQPLCREGKAGAAAAPGGVVPHTRKKIKKGFINSKHSLFSLI